MNKYRIYAKIIGPTLPNTQIAYEECFIAPMTVEEQEKRKFKPIEANSPKPTDEDFYKAYVTHHRVADPRIIKTGHIIWTDVETHDVGSALGHAIKRFEKITGTLAITSLIQYEQKHNRKFHYTNYEYQISRIYKLEDDKESDAEVPVFAGGMVSHINLPSQVDMSVLDEKLVERMLKSRDDIFWKSLSYLQSGEKGFHNNTPTEKMTLDFMKSMEIIVDLWKSKKRKENTFDKKLNRTSKELGLDKDDCVQIKKLWKLRSDGDVAHARQGSKVDFYPAQYPVPSNIDGPYIDSSAVAVRVLTKYFLFRDSILSIKISNESHDELDELIDVNQGTAFTIRPSDKNKKTLAPFLKRKIKTHFGVPIKNIRLYGYQPPYIHFRISDHLKFDLHKNKIPKKRLVIFGSI
jgi:hypothetical protein